MAMSDQDQGQAPNQGIDMSEAGPSDMAGQDEAQGAVYEICIRVNGQMSFEVYVEQGGEESASGDAGQSFSTFADALRECLRLYKENPPSDAGAEDQLQAGFGSPEQKV